MKERRRGEEKKRGRRGDDKLGRFSEFAPLTSAPLAERSWWHVADSAI